MKSFLVFFSTILMMSFILPTTANACWGTGPIATITPGGGRCSAPAGVPTVYTGTHNFSSAGCAVYRWTITGGTLVGPDGISITSGQTLCVVENPECNRGLDNFCDVNAPDPQLGTLNSSSVTVTWFPGEVGTLKLKAVDSTYEASDYIINDLSLPAPDYLAISSTTETSTTFNAIFPMPLCSGASVRWTIDGVLAGNGNPKTLPVTACADATVCAYAIQPTTTGGIVTGATTCRTLTSTIFSGSVTGQSQATVEDVLTYTLYSTHPIASANWYTSTLSVAAINSTSGNTADAIFFGVGSVDICAQGTTTCGVSFDECQTVYSSPSGLMMIGSNGEEDTHNDRGGVELTLTPEDFDLSSSKGVTNLAITEMNLYPSPASKGQEVVLQLPIVAENAMLTITDMDGRTLWQQKTMGQNTVIRTEDFPIGIYLLTAQAGEWTETTKFVIN